jgi:fatty-acyl-CoA synthase
MTTRTSEIEGGYAFRIMSALADDRDRPVLRWQERELTADDLHRAVCRQVRALRRLGAGPGDLVAVLVAPDSPLVLTARYAAHLVGAAVCSLGSVNPAADRDGPSISAQQEMLRSTRARFLVFDDTCAERAEHLAKLAEHDLALIGVGVDAGPGAGPGGRSPDDAPLTPQEAAGLPVWDPDALAMIVYTSGSSGAPKGIRLAYRAWEAAFAAANAAVWPGEQVRFLVVTSLSHTVGPMVDGVINSAGYVVTHRHFDPADALAAIEKHQLTRIYLAVTQLYRLLDCPAVADTRLSSLRQVMYGGSPAAPARIAEAVRVLGMTLIQGYGTSEGGRVSFLHPGEHQNPALHSTVGRLFPEVAVKICDPETHEELEPGQTGEVCTRSPQMMDGYWDNPDLTARVLVDGWYRTGDIGHLDADGYLRLLDRLGDVIKVSGIKVYPSAVEGVIAELPAVAQAAVYGVRDADNVEHVTAAVVARRGATVTAEEIRARVAERMSPVHAPEQVLLLDEMPLSPSGKPDKRRLRAEAVAT